MTDIDRWILSYQGRVANIWYNHDYTVYGVNPSAGGQAPGDNNIVTLVSLGNGVIGLRCNAVSSERAPSSYASVRDDYGFQVQFQAPGGGWITNPDLDEHLKVVPTGDGYFALYWVGKPGYGPRYVTVDGGGNPKAGNCNALRANTGDISRAARFTATTLNPGRDLVADLLDVSNSASGLSFAGMNLAGRTLRGDLSLCDFRRAASLNGCVMDGAVLRKASFAGQHLAGLSIKNADCTGTDFTSCDFSSFVPGTPPPVLAGAILTGAVVPAGNTWSGAKMPGAVLAGANLTGCDLSGTASAPTDLTGAIIGGVGGTQFTPFFTPAYQGGGIGGYDMKWPTDRVIAYDGDGQGKANYLVCYRPGRGAAGVVYPQGPGFGHVLLNGDPGGGMGAGLGGYTLADPADQIIAFDYRGAGSLDHLVCYRPGKGLFSIIEKKTDANNNVTFGKVYDSANGITGDCNLSDPADRIIAYDFLGTGHLDHLVCYRPATGRIWIVEKNVDGNNKVTFSAVYTSTSGIGHYDLLGTADRLIAYDYESSGHPNYLLCYRPGGGAMTIARWQGGTFANVYLQGDPGGGIGDPDLGHFSLLDPLDQIIAYDHAGTGHLDHLVCYRPVAGLIMILKKVSDKDDPSAFVPVYWERFGVGGYDLGNPADQVIAYDYAATGHLDHLVCYRPGLGTIWVSRPSGGPATLDRCNLGNANLTGASLAGADLTTAATLAGANLSRTHLQGTNLSGTHLEGADLSGTQMQGAKLDGANLSGATLAGTNFTGLDLTRVAFSAPLKRSPDLANPTIFTGCTLPYAAIGLDWSNLDLTSATINGLPKDLTGLVAVGLHWNNGYFEECILDRANFAHAVLARAHFTSAKLRNAASFASATLTGAIFTSAVLEQTDFSSAVLGGVESEPNAVLSFAFISNCTFTGATLTGVDFSSATLVSGNKLTGAADLEEANFADAYLPGADFTGADLRGAEFDGAFMVQVTLTNADLSPSQHGAKSASLTAACMQQAALEGTKLYSANLSDAVITSTVGSIVEQHYGEDGTLTPPSAMHYRPGKFPDAASFSEETICPNRDTYKDNKQQGLDIPRMMQTRNPPPTKWAPKQMMPKARRASQPILNVRAGARREQK